MLKRREILAYIIAIATLLAGYFYVSSQQQGSAGSTAVQAGR